MYYKLTMIMRVFSVFDPGINLNYVIYILPFIFFFFIFFSLFRFNRLSFFLKEILNFINHRKKETLKKDLYLILLSIRSFFLILVLNLVGFLPYLFRFTGHLYFTLSLSLILTLRIFKYALYYNFYSFGVHITPKNTPIYLAPFMVIVEIVSIFIRPFTLAVRLIANIVAGHILVILVTSLIVNIINIRLVGIFLGLFFLNILELAVCVIQSYVFSILITLYVYELIN